MEVTEYSAGDYEVARCGIGCCSSGNPDAICASTRASNSDRCSIVYFDPSTGWPKRTTTSPGRIVHSPLRIKLCAPEIETGTTGTPAWIAITKVPFLNGRIRPSGLRVPSGYTANDKPSLRTRTANSTLAAAASLSERSTGTNFAIRIAVEKIGM